MRCLSLKDYRVSLGRPGSKAFLAMCETYTTKMASFEFALPRQGPKYDASHVAMTQMLAMSKNEGSRNLYSRQHVRHLG
jgi:hypothetical protein